MKDCFDIVIVGAGSAGCVLAARLAEAGVGSVCLLEAGPRSWSPFVHVPAGYYRTMSDPKINWGFETSHQDNLGGRRIACPRGRLLGGSSAVNGLIYIRGQHEDYDGWERAGNRGWAWAQVLPYFKRSEDNALGADHYHGTGGSLGVSHPAIKNDACDAFVEAAQNLGVPFNPDFNGETQEGVGYFQLTIRRGLRTPASRFLSSSPEQKNIELRVCSDVDRIGFQNGKARYVEYRFGGRAMRVEARRAVVLCAGAIGTPAILQRSGIGPRKVLARLGIAPILIKEDVGRHLQDHYQARVVFKCLNSASLNLVSRNYLWRLKAGIDFVMRRSGPLTIGAGVVGLFARSRPDLDRPDIQFHVMPFSVDRPGDPFHPFAGFTVSVCELRPKSRGTVEIVSRNAAVPPAIDPQYFSHPDDGWAIARGIQLARDIAQAKPLKYLTTGEHEPGPGVADLVALREYAAARGSTIFHPCGTCRMGADEQAVVDHNLKVNGTSNLWIADASIMPSIVSGNTNAACVMIGERGAESIARDLKSPVYGHFPAEQQISDTAVASVTATAATAISTRVLSRHGQEDAAT